MNWMFPLAAAGMAAAVVFMVCMRRRNRRLTAIAASGLILVGGAVGYAAYVRMLSRDPPGYDPTPERSLGRISAEEVARRAVSRRILVIGHAASDARALSAGRVKTEAFLEAAERAGLVVVDRISPLEPYSRESDPAGEEYPQDTGLDGGSLWYASEHYPDVRVIVCLEGTPVRGLDPAADLGGRQIMAIDWYSTGEWAPFLESGLLDMVVAFRRRLGPAPLAPRPSYREIFDQRFLVVTAENLDACRTEVLVVPPEGSDP